MQRLWLVAKSLLALAILLGVGVQFHRVLSQPQFAQTHLTIRYERLLPAALLYLMAQCCWGAFWVRLLRAEGIAVTWTEGLRVYFVSQFGKYIPGKVMVILIRVAMLRRDGFALLPVGVTATYETLTSMGAGALVGVLLLPYLGVLPLAVSGKTTLLLALAALPIALGVLNKYAVRIANRKRGPDARALPAPSLSLLAQGLLHGVCGWCLLGVSLALVVESIEAGPPAGISVLEPPANEFLADLGAVSLAYVAGFVILVAPGGLGVRELVLVEVLTPRLAGAWGAEAAEGVAATIALLLRLSWTAAEVALAGVLYFMRPRSFIPRPRSFLPSIMADAHHGLLSLVIPVLNERESLSPLAAEIFEAARGLDRKVEVIFVDDGSTDGSWEAIRDLSAADDRVKGIRFRRNFGKAAALYAGFQSARGSVTMTLDADLQDDPREIPRFLAMLNQGYDVVSGWKKVRLDPWHKVFPSRVFNGMVGWVTGVRLHDHNCGMKAYKAEVLREISLHGELHRFVPILAVARGFKIGELVINHRPRRFGHSKYRWPRFIKGFLDLGTVHFLTKFGRRPQHLLGSYGLLLGCLGVLGVFLFAVLLWTGLNWRDAVATTTGAVGLGLSFTLLSAAGFFLVGGLLAELATARKMREQEPFSIAERTTHKGEEH